MPETDPATATGGPATEPSPEDAKLLTLARATRARTRAAEGAAVRDLTGRTYAAATVDLPSLRLSALAGCVAMAVASGAEGLEAALVHTAAGTVADADLDALRDLAGTGVTVHRAGPSGVVQTTST